MSDRSVDRNFILHHGLVLFMLLHLSMADLLARLSAVFCFYTEMTRHMKLLLHLVV